MKRKTILITGAYGFVGINLSNILKDNYTLWALDVIEKPLIVFSRHFSWKLLDTLPWNEIDIIIHLAAKVHDLKKRQDKKIYFEVNTELTKKIFDRYLKSGAKQFFFFSSSKAAANIVEGDFLTEDVSPKPVGPYGESKLAAEEYILSSAAINQRQKFYIFRPCMIHGPGNKGNLKLLYDVISKGIPWPLGAFDNKRSFLSIHNLSYIIEQFINQSPESGIYNLADDEPVSTNELIGLIAESGNRKIRMLNLNRSFVSGIAKIGTICNFPFNMDRLQKLTGNFVVSNNKLKQAIGIEKLPFEAKEGLKQTLKTF